MTQSVATPAAGTLAPPNAKQQYIDVYTREHQTTLKVLRCFPQDQAHYQPHPRSSTALKLAWTFVVENNVALASLHGPLQLGSGFPPPPETFAEVIAAYESSTRELLNTIAVTPDSRLSETIKFFSGPGQ